MRILFFTTNSSVEMNKTNYETPKIKIKQKRLFSSPKFDTPAFFEKLRKTIVQYFLSTLGQRQSIFT